MLSITPRDVLELPVDELALLVLEDIDKTQTTNENEFIYRHTDVQDSPFRLLPNSNAQAVIEAISEAISWLRARSLIAHRPQDSRIDTFFITRLGVKVLQEGLSVVKTTERLQDNLHPLILRKARRQFLLGEYENAVFVSMKAVEIRVRKLSGLGNDTTGVDLMTKAFKSGGALADSSAPAGEIQGTMFMFAGAYAVLRNPSGHREVEYDDVTEAAEAVITASLLMRILDKVEQRISS